MKRPLPSASTVILWTIALVASIASGDHHSRDFHFENDKVVLYSEPYNPQEKSLSSSSISCPYSEDKLVLALVLKDKNWESILPRKRERAISKLAKFFTLTKSDLAVDDVTKYELQEMSKRSLHHGKNQVNLSKKVGRVEFMIGCGKQYSVGGKLIANQIGHQMKEKSIDDISGLDFGWWLIYSKHPSNKTPRARREAEGSTEDDYEYYDGDDDDPEPITETPVTSTTHARRHHHGLSNKQNGIAGATAATAAFRTTPQSSQIMVPVVVIPAEDVETPEPVRTTTYRNELVEKEVSELAKTILKTIENNEKVEAMEEGLEPGETLKPDDFDDVIDKVELRPIVKEVFENGEREGDYIVEDISSVFTNTIFPSTRDRIPDTPPLLVTSPNHQTSHRASDPPSSTFDTIRTSPNEAVTEPGTAGTTTTTARTMTTTMTGQQGSETGSTTTELGLSNTNDNDDPDNDNNDDEDYVVSTRIVEQTKHTESSSIETETQVSISQSSTSPAVTTSATTNKNLHNNDHFTTTPLTPIFTTDSDYHPPTFHPHETPLNFPHLSLNFSSSIASKPALTPAATATNKPLYDDYEDESSSASYSSLSPEPVTVFSTISTPSTSTSTQAITSTSITTNEVSSSESDSVESQTNVDDQNETTPRSPFRVSTSAGEEENYDDEYDDNYDDRSSPNPGLAKTSSTSTSTTEATIEEEVPTNNPPTIKNRLPKAPVTAGKPFKIHVPLENFDDVEDGHRLTLELLDKNDYPLKPNSWIQFSPERREIYGLPLEDAVSRYKYHLRATDSGNESVTEDIDISVQQHKGHRSVNHEIEIVVRLNEKFDRIIDWQLRLIDAISKVLRADESDVVVRELRPHSGDVNSFTFVYTNESLPKDFCPEEEVEALVEAIDLEDLNKLLDPSMVVKSVRDHLVGNCKKQSAKTKVTSAPSKNFPPVPRNQVDRVNATVGQLLVFRVPADTFYDPEDETDLRLSLLSVDRTKLDPHHWLQFDPKNREFYGVPKPSDVGQKEYVLIAEDREGLTANDALVVVVVPAQKRDYSALFDFILGISYESFNNSDKQRRFIENVGEVFGDSDLSHVLVRNIRRQNMNHNVAISWYNTTLHRPHHRCPTHEIEQLRETLMHSDSSLRDRVKETLGSEFNLVSVNIHPVGACQGEDTRHHEIPVKVDEPQQRDGDDYLLTFVLPAVIILAMLLLASIVACVLHRRRLTGKMELGDEEERKSFRNKGIPVIFQDELDEKPDIASKSPIILKEEKPALLPPTYNGTNPEGDHEDLDEYVPPPGVGPINSRESRGKSPVTPSYRRPPPYVSP